MDRRDFLKWLGGGIAAVTALSSDVVLQAQRQLGLAGEIDPETLLWVPGVQKIIVPPEKLVMEVSAAGVGAYRLTNQWGTFWFDRDGALVDVLDRNGRPTAILDGYGPDLAAVMYAIGDGSGWNTRTETKTVHWPTRGYESPRYSYSGTLARWPTLTGQPAPERDRLTRVRIDW